jgi:hypothetical protein
MNYSAGYVKDFLAVFGFMIAFVIIYSASDLHRMKKLVLVYLTIAILIDGIYSLNEDFHNEKIGYNLATYSIVGAIVLFVGIFGIYLTFT